MGCRVCRDAREGGGHVDHRTPARGVRRTHGRDALGRNRPRESFERRLRRELSALGVSLAAIVGLFCLLLAMGSCSPHTQPALAQEEVDGPGVTVTRPAAAGQQDEPPTRGTHDAIEMDGASKPTASSGDTDEMERPATVKTTGNDSVADTADGAAPDNGQDEPAADPAKDAGSTEADTATGVRLAAQADADGAIDVSVSGLAQPATVRVHLGSGVKPRPGIYVTGDALASARGVAVDGVTVVEARVSGDGDVRVETIGATGGAVATSAVELVDDEGEVVALIGPITAPSDAREAASGMRSGERTPFTTVGRYNNTATPTTNSIPRIGNAETGVTAYCNDMMLAAPGDPLHGSNEPVWYDSWSFPSDPWQAADQGQNVLDYVLFHGYPSDPTIGGRCANPQDAESATQWAIWYFTNPGSSPYGEAPFESWSPGFRESYDTLVAEANSYDAACRADPDAFRPERGTCQVWTVADAALQDILTARPNYGWLDLTKASDRPDLVASHDAYALGSAAFEVRHLDGSVEAALTTDDAGRAGCLLPVGSYRLVETRAPAGHAPDGAQRELTIAGGPVHVSVSVTDPALLGGISLTKRGGGPDGPAVAGARFSLVDATSGTEMATLVTDGNGRAATAPDALPLGRYVLREASAPDGYAPAGDIEITVDKPNALKEVAIVDPYKTTLSVTKTSAKTGQGLPGARLQVLNGAGSVVDEWVSDGSPHELRDIAPGRYRLHELEAPRGYVVADDVSFDVRLTSEAQHVDMVDERALVPFSFKKLDAISRAPLPGATFALYRSKGPLPKPVTQRDIRDDALWDSVDAQGSQSDGTVSFGELEEGTYLLLEEAVPSGYMRPSGGWLVHADSAEGITVESVGDVPNPPFEDVDGRLSVANYRQSELPRAGGTGALAPLLTGASLVAVGSAAAARRRRAARRALPVALFILVASLACIVLSLPALALARPSELPDPDHAASLSVHKYALPDASEPAEPSDGGPVPEGSLPQGATPIEGVTFDIRRAYSQGEADALVSQGAAKREDFSPANVEGTEFAGYVVRTGDETLSEATNANGQARFDLSGRLGAWLVTEQPDPRVEIPCPPFIASVPMPHPNDERAWLYDVHVYPKNYRIDVDKAILKADGTVMNTSAAGGEPVTFRIACDIPATVGRNRSYVVTDRLDWRIATTQDAPEAAVVRAGSLELQPGTDFTARVEETTDDQGRPCQLLTWDFTPGLARLQQAVDEDGRPGAIQVVIEFVARLDEDAVSGTLDNGATLDIVNELGRHSAFETARPTVSFAAITIDKCEAADPSLKLPGATFRIAASLDDAREGRWLHRLATDGSDQGVWEETSDADGAATFAALRYDLESGSDYFLVETQAPERHQAIPEPIRVHVGPEPGLQSVSDLTAHVQVLNASSPTLPNTGGRGAIVQVAIGMLVVLGGVSLCAVLSLRQAKRPRTMRGPWE